MDAYCINPDVNLPIHLPIQTPAITQSSIQVLSHVKDTKQDTLSDEPAVALLVDIFIQLNWLDSLTISPAI
jgi:hypothetical protein